MKAAIRDLRDMRPGDDGQFGGKAVGLGRLLRSGVRVPRGFAVRACTESPTEWDESLRGTFLARAGELLREGPIAVRSSAVGEDGQDRSFAGLFESRLDVCTPDEALRAATECVRSGDSERVRSYAGADQAVPVGLVVQRQVEARAAGVVFTRDPVGRDPGLLVEAVRGAGEALVSGSAQPERFRVYGGDAGALEVHRDPGSATHALSAPVCLVLTREARELCAAFGEDLDLEFVLDAKGRLWWLQARPITTGCAGAPAVHIERSVPEALDGPITVWSNLNVRETMPDPLSLLAWSLWRDRIVPAMAQLGLDFGDSDAARELSILDRINGRVYWNINAVIGIPGFDALVDGVMRSVDAQAVETLQSLRARGIVTPRRYTAGRLRFLLAAVLGQCRSIPAVLRALDPDRSLRELRASADRLSARAQEPLKGRSDHEIVAEIFELSAVHSMNVAQMFASLTLAVMGFEQARSAFAHEPEAQALLGQGIRNNPTTAMSVAVEELADLAAPVAGLFLAGHPPEVLLERLHGVDAGRGFLEALDRFLAVNGQRCPGEFDLQVPRWIDDPTLILELVSAHLREPAKERAAHRIDRLERERHVAIDAAVARAPAWRRGWLRFWARWSERHLPLREAGKHSILWSVALIRRRVVELGQRWAAEGTLAEGDDIFHLDLGELRAFTSRELPATALRTRIADRKLELDRFRQREAEGFVRSDGIPVPTPRQVSEDGSLQGAGLGTGSARGTVRILDRPDPAALHPGDVLVVRFADPGWTPLFSRAGGLVMEVGGLMCHAAVVARELGIPAVFGVTGATEVLEDGQEVVVDGTRGTVSPC